MAEALISGRVDRSLRDIGLTEYESLAYLALVKSGELTAGKVSEFTSIPYSKVYSVLDSLDRKGWIEVKGGRPRLYYPKSPVEALMAEQLKQEKVFVHCRTGSRVGAAMMCKRALKDGVPAERAEEEAGRIGLRSEALRQFAREYIANHKADVP